MSLLERVVLGWRAANVVDCRHPLCQGWVLQGFGPWYLHVAGRVAPLAVCAPPWAYPPNVEEAHRAVPRLYTPSLDSEPRGHYWLNGSPVELPAPYPDCTCGHYITYQKPLRLLENNNIYIPRALLYVQGLGYMVRHGRGVRVETYRILAWDVWLPKEASIARLDYYAEARDDLTRRLGPPTLDLAYWDLPAGSFRQIPPEAAAFM